MISKFTGNIFHLDTAGELHREILTASKFPEALVREEILRYLYNSLVVG